MNYSIATNTFKSPKKRNHPFILSILLTHLILLASCEQSDDSNQKIVNSTTVEQPTKIKYNTTHQYGGWYCPDNIKGFPAVDIQELDQVPVVNGRLPTKEETRNGTALLFFDTTHVPSARPLEMTMPKLARYYSEDTKKNEVVIVIQAVVAENDTVVGFRYLNGGNGSAWFGEVDFLADEEIDQLGATPFVSLDIELDASTEKIWDVITSPTHAKELGGLFAENAFVESDWKANSKVYFKYGPDNIVNTGIITALWENMYIQVDYNFEGDHYVEKFLLLENKETNTAQLHISSGPYGEDIEGQKVVWGNWLEKVKNLSEVEYDE